MNKKHLVILSVASLITIGISESTFNDRATADYRPVSQTLKVPDSGLLDRAKLSANFNRVSITIKEIKPWLKKENQAKRLSKDELRSILNKAGFTGKGLEMAMVIAFYESTYRPYALNRSSNCYGLFQINMTGSMGKVRREKYGLSKNEDLFNPFINASIAYKMSNGGKNWSAWTTEKMAKRSISN